MTEPIKFTIGEITYAYGWTFLGCLGLAIVVVFFFSMTKFNESTIAKDEDDLISQLLPRFLATSEQYSRALMIYLAAMSAIVVVLSLLGPRVAYLGAVNLPDAALGPVKLPDAPDVLPLIIALVMVGMLPNVPWLQELERQLRRFAHERAFIPTTARATAERLATAEFDFSSYEADDVLGSCAMRGVERTDFVAPRDSIEYSWARLSCLLHHVRKIQNADAVVSLDNEMLTRYAQDLESLALKRKTMQGDIAQYRQEKAKDRYYSNDDLHRSIRKTLRKVYVLLGCAVRLKFNTDDAMNPALRSFGFLMDTQMAKSDNNNVIIVGLGVMTVSIFAIVYAAAELGALARGFEDLGRFWTPWPEACGSHRSAWAGEMSPITFASQRRAPLPASWCSICGPSCRQDFHGIWPRPWLPTPYCGRPPVQPMSPTSTTWNSTSGRPDGRRLGCRRSPWRSAASLPPTAPTRILTSSSSLLPLAPRSVRRWRGTSPRLRRGRSMIRSPRQWSSVSPRSRPRRAGTIRMLPPSTGGWTGRIRS